MSELEWTGVVMMIGLLVLWAWRYHAAR